MAEKQRDIIYEPHPVSAERKATLLAQGYRIVDKRFEPVVNGLKPITVGERADGEYGRPGVPNEIDSNTQHGYSHGDGDKGVGSEKTTDVADSDKIDPLATPNAPLDQAEPGTQGFAAQSLSTSPSAGLTKEQLIEALTAKGIEFKSSASKAELAELLDSAEVQETTGE
ncbi:HeH/LEM domain-containing protein [Erwinia phage Gungnir39]|nr:HeH/LEM domain-containing protein [Erwinia phage Gungnir39]